MANEIQFPGFEVDTIGFGDSSEDSSLYTGLTDFQRLCDFLKSRSSSSFNADSFKSTATRKVNIPVDHRSNQYELSKIYLGAPTRFPDYQVMREVEIPASIPLVVRVNGERAEVYPVRLGLRTKLDLIRYDGVYPDYDFTSEDQYIYTFTWRYVDAEGVDSDEGLTGYDLGEYSAVVLKFHSYSQARAVLQYLDYQYEQFELITFNRLSNIRERHVASGDSDALDEFYRKCPEEFLLSLDDAQLDSDLLMLLERDEASWFEDSSTSIYNCLVSFKDYQLLFLNFYTDGELVKRIYNILSSESREAFCQLITALSLAYHPGRDNAPGVAAGYFKVGKLTQGSAGVEFLVDSDLNFERSASKVYLEQQTKFTGVAYPGVDIWTLFFGFTIESQGELDYLYNPCDIISLHKYVDGELLIEEVSAIYIKLLADKQEVDEIIDVVTTTIILVSIVVSAGTLGVGTVFVQALAITDLSFAVVDLALQSDSLKSSLSSTESGKWFVSHWSVISASVGVGMISQSLAKGIVKHGPSVIAQLSKRAGALPQDAKRLIQAIESLKTNVQTAAFIRNSGGFGMMFTLNLSTVFLSTFSKIARRRIKTLGFRLGKIEGADDQVLVYRKMEIASGSEKELQAKLKDLLTRYDSDAELRVYLDRTYLKFTDELLADLAELGLKHSFATRFTKNIKLTSFSGADFYRLSPEGLRGVVRFLKMSSKRRVEVIEDAVAYVKANSKQIYKPSRTFERTGLRIKNTKRGLSGTFEDSLEHVFRNSKDSFVKIKLTGRRDLDFKEANRILKKRYNLSDLEVIAIEQKYVWHHVDDIDSELGATLQLITVEAHKKIQPHVAVALLQRIFGASKYYL